MSLQFVTGCSGSGKSTYLYSRFIKEAMGNPNKNYVIIVPEQFTLQTQKELVNSHPDGGILNIDILSFNRLAYRVCEELGKEVATVLDDTGKNMILRKVIEGNKDRLGVYGRNYNKQGFISEIKSFISELYQYSITPEYIEDFIENNPDNLTNKKLNEINVIFKEFRNYLEEKYITSEELLDILAYVIDDSKEIKDAVICLDGYTGFTPSQMKLIERLLCIAEKMYVSITIDDKVNDKETDLFHMGYQTKKKFIKLARINKIDVEDDINVSQITKKDENEIRFVNSNELGFVEKQIFRIPKKKYPEECNDVKVFSMTTYKDEIECAAQEILKLVSNGYHFGDIALVCGDIEKYGDIASQIFRKYKIPCFVDYKKKIMDNAFVELLMSVYDIVNSNYSYDAVFRFVRNPLSGISVEDADFLENYALGAGIRGLSMWKNDWVKQYRYNYEEYMEGINATRAVVYSKLCMMKDMFCAKGTISEYAKKSMELANAFECEKHLAKMADEFADIGEYVLEKEYSLVYEQVMELFSQMQNLLGATKDAKSEVELEEFVKIFEAGIAEIKTGLIPMGSDIVVIGDVERTRLNGIKALFIVGANDGLIPKTSMAGSVISDIEREMLSQLGFELSPTRRQSAFIGQYYMYMNLTKPSDKLYISYSSLDESAKKINPSYLIGWILGIFPKMEVIKYQDVYRNDGLDMLFEGISKRNIIPLDSKWNEVLKWNLTKNENTTIVEKMLDTVFDENCDVDIPEDVAKELYKEKQYSLSRFEKYASCAYAHFLQYGIGVRERDEYEIKVPDIGTILHTTMEGYSMTLEEKKLTWDSITREESDEIMSECIQKAVEGFENGILFSNPRNMYKVKQIERIAKRCANVLNDHAKSSKFIPNGFEVRFDDTVGVNRDKKLRGIVDRVDLFQDEDGNKMVKVIDYKSGNKHFDTALFKEGISMQLIVYMGAMLGSVKNSVPAGVFYFRFNDPVVDGENSLVSFNGDEMKNIYHDDEIDASIAKEMKMQGLVNKDNMIIEAIENGAGYNEKGKFISETFNVKTDEKGGKDISGEGVLSTQEFISLIDYSKEKMNQFNKEIDQGMVKRNPYKYGDVSVCNYCEFAGICRIDSGNENEHCRYIESIKLDDFIKEIEVE